MVKSPGSRALCGQRRAPAAAWRRRPFLWTVFCSTSACILRTQSSSPSSSSAGRKRSHPLCSSTRCCCSSSSTRFPTSSCRVCARRPRRLRQEPFQGKCRLRRLIALLFAHPRRRRAAGHRGGFGSDDPLGSPRDWLSRVPSPARVSMPPYKTADFSAACKSARLFRQHRLQSPLWIGLAGRLG